MDNNALGLKPNDFGKGLADVGMSQTSLGASMLQSGASPDEIAAALVKNAQGDMPEGQDAVIRRQLVLPTGANYSGRIH